jgi:glycosyltransferase involved in cell wall biosynthesis
VKVGIGPFAAWPSGIPVAVADTARALRAQGIEVTLFAVSHDEIPPDLTDGPGTVVRLAALPRVLRTSRGSDALFLGTRLALSRRWAAALEDHSVDIVHSFSPGCLTLLPRRQPAVAQAWFYPPGLRARLATMLPFAPPAPPLRAAHAAVEVQAQLSDALGYRRADLILANTPTAEAGMRQRGLDSRCVPPPIWFPEALAEREPSDTLRLVFCGHPLTNRRKGLGYLLDALPLVEGGPLEVTLIGGGAHAFAGQIERARRAGVTVETLGRVPREAYLDHLARRADLLVFTSLYEEWGYALLEALSRGVPAIAFDLYPFFDILDEDTGRVVEPRQPGAVARGIEAALRGELPSPERVRESTRRRFSQGAVVPQLLAAYESVLAERLVRARA